LRHHESPSDGLKVGDAKEFFDEAKKPDLEGMVLSCLDMPVADHLGEPEGLE
jgi:hypothetical protein